MLKLVALVVSFSLVNGQFSCDIVDDDFNACLGVYNGICENDQSSCRNADCFDCDPCRAFNFDCSGCLSSGCSWCDADFFCSSGPITHDSPYNRFGLPSCGTTGWVTGGSASVCPATASSLFNDPLYDTNEWAYTLMNVQPVWEEGITGAGVRVRLNDDGFARDHPEFTGRFDEAASCPVYWDPQDDHETTHGTAVASILGAAADNGEGAMGIAPEVIFSACIFDFTAPFLGVKVDSMDISVNSWGVDACFEHSRRKRRRELQGCPFTGTSYSPCSASECFGSSFDIFSMSSSCGDYVGLYCSVLYEDDAAACDDYLFLYVNCDYTDPIDNFRAQEQGLLNGINRGRNGLGVVYVFASGNEYSVGEDVNAELHLNSRFTISVAAVGKDGLHASYSSAGAPVLISAPGGDSESFTNWIVAVPPLYGGGYHDGTFGTSFACPAVAGVVALMLEANPNLTWNDVQGILATTASEVTSDPDVTFTTNAAGLHHANEYGFGIVDAAAAVAAAKTWTSYGPEYSIVKRTVVGSRIANSDESSSLTSTVIVEDGGSEFYVQSVVVELELDHFSRGDLEIVLTSPGGTKSVMHPGRRPENTNDVEEPWELMTVRNWGESVVGTWTLTVTDVIAGDLDVCADNEFSIYDGNSQITCDDVAWSGACIDGVPRSSFLVALREEDEHGNSALSSCCLCGGGSYRATNVLTAWTLRAYGNMHIPGTPPRSSSVRPSAYNQNVGKALLMFGLLAVVSKWWI